MHAESPNAVFPQDLLLSSVYITQSNVDQLLQRDLVLSLEPAKGIFTLLRRQASEKRNRHAVNIPTVARLGSIDISVGVYPDNCQLSTESLANGLRSARNGTNSNAVVATEGENQAALARVSIDLFRQLLVHGRDSERVLHVAVVGVGLRDQLFVGMDGIVMVELVAQLFAQLGEQAGRDEG